MTEPVPSAPRARSAPEVTTVTLFTMRCPYGVCRWFTEYDSQTQRAEAYRFYVAHEEAEHVPAS